MRSLRALLLVLIFVLSTASQASCQSIGRGPADGTQIALSAGASSIALTDEARDLAKELNLLSLLDSLDQLKTRVQSSDVGAAKTLDGLAARQELLEARQDYERRILKASLEVDYVMATIEGEQNRFAVMRSDLESNRDTSVLLTNIAAQVSNGVLWVYRAVSIASETKPQYNVKDGVNGIVAGALPTVLGLYALYQLRGPARKLPANPNMLAPLLGTGQDARHYYYPKSVMDFLNATPAGQSTSRRQLLIAQWEKNKSLSKPEAKDYNRSAQIISGTLAQRRALTIALLSKQQSMLSDLRTQVCSMKRGILELMPALD